MRTDYDGLDSDLQTLFDGILLADAPRVLLGYINMTCTGMSCAFSIRVAFLTYIIVLVRLFILLRLRHKLHSSFKPCTMIEINRRTGTLKASG